MKKNVFLLYSIGIILFITPLTSIHSQQSLSAKEIVKISDENMRGNSSQANITIKIIRPSWSREMNMKTWTKGDDYSMILVTNPAKEKGTVFLKREREVWNWIPSIERTRAWEAVPHRAPGCAR